MNFAHIYYKCVLLFSNYIIIKMRLWHSVLGPIVMSLPTIISCVFTYIPVPMAKYLSNILMPKRCLKRCWPNESQGRLGIMRTFYERQDYFLPGASIVLVSYGRNGCIIHLLCNHCITIHVDTSLEIILYSYKTILLFLLLYIFKTIEYCTKWTKVTPKINFVMYQSATRSLMI